MSKVTLTHCGQFNASHGHGGTLCEDLHRHTFAYEVTFSGELNKEGYLIDFRLIAQVLQEKINAPLTDTDLGTILENPTTEALCIWIFNTLKPIFPQLIRVKTAEASDRWVEYEGE